MKRSVTYFIAALTLLVNFNGCVSLGPKRGVEANADIVQVKLPNDVVPIKYDLNLWVNPSAEDFPGKVAIDVQISTERNDFLLHAEDISVSSVRISNNEWSREAKFSRVNDHGLLRIFFGEKVPQGRYRIDIDFRGKFASDLSGLYKVNEGGETYLFTQFEPIAARKMFPCFDEPRFKTPFDIKIISPKGQKVIANSPLKQIISEGNEDTYVFLTTKPISTYLLALAVGPFDVVEGQSLAKNNYRNEVVPFRGIATKGKGEQLKLALAETPKIIAQLEEYFGLKYPYPKLDIIAIPDFAAGAMENVGAITFREVYLLLDDKTASVEQRRNFYSVMAHELAHQWFGNSVTMPWWDDLWLNEAFASWLSYKIVDKIKPEYKSAEKLLTHSHYAMAEDSLLSARKIREQIVTHHDIHNAFDSITYLKGGAVISMLENYLGAARFREAVSLHLKRYEDKTATSQDFLESLAKYSDPTLVSSAETFLNQTGVPHVNLSYTCEDKKFRLKVEQSRYVPIGGKTSSNGSWNIPMCVSFDDANTLKKHCFTMNQPSMKIDVTCSVCPNFVMPNAKGQGYYRFSMNLEAWKNLLSASSNQIGEVDRLAIADSLVAEFYRGGLDFAFVSESLHTLINGNSWALTRYFVQFMKEASNYWVSNENRSSANVYMQKALKNIYSRLKKTRDLSSDQISLKKELASFLAHVVKDEQVRLDLSVIGSNYLRRLKPALDQERSLFDTDEHDLIGDGLAVSMQFEDDAVLSNVAEELALITDTVMRNHLLFGLARSREGKEAHLIRKLVWSDHLRRNERLRLFYDHLDNPRNQPETWRFIKSYWPKLKKTLSKPQIADLPSFSKGLCDADSASQVLQFFSPFIADYQGGPRTLALAIEEIEICAARKNHAGVLANRFFGGQKEDEAVVEQKPAPPPPPKL